MSFESLLDHTVQIHRPGVAQGNLREDNRVYSPLGAPAAFFFKRPSALLADIGPGLAAQGERTGYCGPLVDVRERDVLQILTGPEASSGNLLWEVDAPVTRPRAHHAELRLRPFKGRIAAEGS